MNALQQDMETTTSHVVEIENEITGILQKEFRLTPEDGTRQNDDYNAVGYMAIDVCLRLMNVLRNLKAPGTGLGYKATMDLSIGLNGNAFWARHASILMPLLHISLQAHADYVQLTLAKTNTAGRNTLHDAIISESQLVGLEIFSMIAYLLGGAELMSTASLNLKKQLFCYLG